LLVRGIVAGQRDLGRIDDDDIVAIVNVRGECRLVLAAQTVGDEGGETANDETFGVDQHPLLRHFRRLLRKGFHGVVSISIPAGKPAGRFLLLEPMANALDTRPGSRLGAYTGPVDSCQLASNVHHRKRASKINVLIVRYYFTSRFSSFGKRIGAG